MRRPSGTVWVTAHLVWKARAIVIGRPRRDTTEVIDTYQALEARLEPFTGEFDKPVARISETAAEHQQRDADVAEIVDELTELTKKHTAKLLTAATRAARRHRRRAAEDEAALAEALDSLTERFGPAEQMAPIAEATLDLALRVVLARWVIGSSRPQTDPATSATGDAVYCEPPSAFAGWRLEAIVDKKVDEFGPQPVPALQGSAGPQWDSRTHAVRLWTLAVAARRREFEEARRPLQHASEQLEKTRRRTALQAERDAHQRQRQEGAREWAQQAQATETEVADFRSRVGDHRRRWRASSRDIRELGLTALTHQLHEGRDAVRDETGGMLIPSVPGIPKAQAHQIAGLVALVLRCNDAATAAARVRELLAEETELVDEQQRLREAVPHLPVDDGTRQAVVEFHPELHRACEWLSAHWDGIAPLLRARGDEAVERLDAALDQSALSP